MKKLFAAIFALGLASSASALTAADYCDAGQCVIYKEVVTAPANSANGSDSQIIFLGGANAKAKGTRTYNGNTCTFEAVVPTPVFEAVMVRFEEQAKADELAPALDPATQTMILFYNSFMAQAKNANKC